MLASLEVFEYDLEKGQIAGKHWSAIVTYRNENIRLISVRRFRDDEVELYES